MEVDSAYYYFASVLDVAGMASYTKKKVGDSYGG